MPRLCLRLRFCKRFAVRFDLSVMLASFGQGFLMRAPAPTLPQGGREQVKSLPVSLPPPLGEGWGGGNAWHSRFLMRAPAPTLPQEGREQVKSLPASLPPPLGEGWGGGNAWHSRFLMRAPAPTLPQEGREQEAKLSPSKSQLASLLALLLLLALSLIPEAAFAQGLPALTTSQGPRGTQYSITLQLLALMTVLTLLPSFLLMMTSFVRIIIVMSLLRQALGTGQTPPNVVLVGLALFLSLFIMQPVLTDVYQNAVTPFMNSKLGLEQALAEAEKPIRAFMLRQTRGDDIALFMQIGRKGEPLDAASVPFTTLVPAFITSELKSAFTIGFLIYIPFIVIDLIVASVLMSMGMMMLSPMMISMPFKLMLFVLVDGWALIMGTLTASFVT